MKLLLILAILILLAGCEPVDGFANYNILEQMGVM